VVSHITAMSATNLNPENDSLTITENEDGSLTMDWDSQDSKWSWLNGLTPKEIQVIVEQAIKDHLNDQQSLGSDERS